MLQHLASEIEVQILSVSLSNFNHEKESIMTSKSELKYQDEDIVKGIINAKNYQIEILRGIINALNVTDKELKVAKEQARFDYRMSSIPTRS